MEPIDIEGIRALLSAKPRPVGWVARRARLDEIGSVWPVAADVTPCAARKATLLRGRAARASGGRARAHPRAESPASHTAAEATARKALPIS
jgi:hypothetical protein